MSLDFPLPLNDQKIIEKTPFEDLRSLRFRGGLPLLSATPTYQGIQGEIVEVDDGTNRKVYCYMNGTWRSIGGDVPNDWQFTGTFSPVDDSNAAWTSGTLTNRLGTTYSIVSGATANVSPSSGNPIFVDYFNSYSAGDLTGQGSWVSCTNIVVGGGSDAILYTVESSVVNEGTNAVAIIGNQSSTGIARGKTVTTRTDGTQIFYFRVTHTGNSRLFFALSADINSSGNNLLFNIGEGGYTYDLGGGHSGSGVLSITANTWHYFSIQWRSSDHKVKVGLDGSDLIGFTASGWSSGGFGALIMQPNNQSGATFYVDTFIGTVVTNSLTYIYFDSSASTTVLQSTTTASSAVGGGKILMGVVTPSSSTSNASFQIYGGSGGMEVNENNVAAGTVVASKLNVSTLSSIAPALGAITSGTLAGITGFGLRDTSAAFDLTFAAVSSSALSAGRTLTFDVINADKTIKLGGNLTTANALITSGNNSLTLTTTGSTNVTLPTSGTLAKTTDITITNAESNSSITPAPDGTYALPTSISIVKGIITAIS